MLRLTRHVGQGVFIQERYRLYLSSMTHPTTFKKGECEFKLFDNRTGNHTVYTIEAAIGKNFSFIYAPTSALLTIELKNVNQGNCEVGFVAPKEINIMRIEIAQTDDEGRPIVDPTSNRIKMKQRR